MLVMLVFMRVLVLVSTAWAVQDINRYNNLGGFYNFADFDCRREEIRLRVEEKIVFKKIDIVPFISQVLEWTQREPNIFKKEKCLILSFG
jgi:hypothetical protein